MNTSRYTRQDGDDHFFGGLKLFALFACIATTCIGGPLLLAGLLADAGLQFWIGCLIFFGIEIICVVCVVMMGVHEMLETVSPFPEKQPASLSHLF